MKLLKPSLVTLLIFNIHYGVAMSAGHHGGFKAITRTLRILKRHIFMKYLDLILQFLYPSIIPIRVLYSDLFTILVFYPLCLVVPKSVHTRSLAHNVPSDPQYFYAFKIKKTVLIDLLYRRRLIKQMLQCWGLQVIPKMTPFITRLFQNLISESDFK